MRIILLSESRKVMLKIMVIVVTIRMIEVIMATVMSDVE